MNSRLRGASKNMYSGVTTRCFLAASWGSFEPPPTLIGAAEVMGSPCGLVFCSGSRTEIGSPCGFVLTSGSRGLLIVASSAFNRRSMGHLPFRRHIDTGGGSPGLKFKRTDVGLVAVNAALQTGIPNGPAVLRQGNSQLFTDALGDLRHLAELGRIHFMDAQHGVLMTLFSTQRPR